jgi:hypothetical protein
MSTSRAARRTGVLSFKLISRRRRSPIAEHAELEDRTDQIELQCNGFDALNS